MEYADVLIRPLVTEKSTTLGESGKYVFEVSRTATRNQISSAVEWAFDVKVISVNVLNVRGKMKRYGGRPSKRPDWKKAIVKLAEGDSIQLFEGA
ncbi:MAG: 50S ribosomal protein L23 [Chloroflexi bacterium]|nr:50S ribosomal protein L23 [Chloroflexota bacterium]|tara:strand:- start:1339 stop:1623 length:285 start_codon:yes stop_codon:yes gene_type:complete